MKAIQEHSPMLLSCRQCSISNSPPSPERTKLMIYKPVELAMDLPSRTLSIAPEDFR
jgi:hypothetical protein